MPLSSNTLIHFTDTKEALMGILSDNFKVFYCKETLVLDEYENIFHVPMVSFCDIPLSEVKDHIYKYGNYGIGLTKDWANKNGLNPVLYVAKKSTISKNIRKTINPHAKKIVGNNLIGARDEIKSALDVVRYMKNYEGTLKRKTEIVENYRFSDEREWRFVPEISQDHEMLILDAECPSKMEKSASSIDKIRLKFEPNDIRYIIIKEDGEISEFINHLKFSKKRIYSKSAIEKLTTRIFTAEQIQTDV